MQRVRPLGPALPRAAGLLLAACLTAAGGYARAQTALVNPDPLAPRLETNPLNPPRFQRSNRRQPASLGQPTTFERPFSPPPSGAGTTGFDATKARKLPVVRPRAGAVANAQALTPGMAKPAPPTPSPYQMPQIQESPQAAQPSEANAAYAAAPPGTPPVPEIGPIRKPPPKRKAHIEPPDPYAPLGIRAGPLTYYPAVELIGGYDTNPGQSSEAKAAWLYTVQPELRVQSDWSRHELKADLRGSYAAYSPDQTPSLNRPYFNGIIDGRVDVTRDTRINLETRALVSTDNPGSPNLQAGLSKLPIYVTYGGSAGVAQRFNRLDLSIKGDADRTVYQDSQLTDGTTSSNDDRNYDQYGGTLRGGYETLPGMVPFAEVKADTRIHDLNADVFGYQRNSNGVTGRAGTTFELRGFLTGEIALGYTIRKYEDPRLADVSGLIADGSLVWTATALTTVKLTGTSSVGESTLPGVSGALYRDVGLQVDHAFRRWLIGTVKVGYGNDDYIGLSRDDNRFSAGVGLTYKLNRSLQLKGEIDQRWLRSNQSENNYNDTLFLLGLRLQR